MLTNSAFLKNEISNDLCSLLKKTNINFNVKRSTFENSKTVLQTKHTYVWTENTNDCPEQRDNFSHFIDCFAKKIFNYLYCISKEVLLTKQKDKLISCS